MESKEVSYEEMYDFLKDRANVGFAAQFGYTLEMVEKDHCIISHKITEQCLSTHRVIHGGVVYAIADHTGGAACYTDLRMYVTLSGSFNYFSNREAGSTIRAEAKVIHRGGRVCTAHVDVTADDGGLLASGDFTYYCIGDKPMLQRVKEK